MRGREEPPELLSVTLPRKGNPDAPVWIRIPERGGFGPEDPNLDRGFLLLRVAPDEAPSSGVERVEPRMEVEEAASPPPPAPVDQRALIQRSVIMAVGLCLIFVLLLVFSGWVSF